MERLIGLDDSLPDVVGCDPGPEHCALAYVTRGPDGSLHVTGLAYPHWHELVGGGTDCLGLVALAERRPFAFAYEKVTSRYGAMPGATTYDTCRNSGIALYRMSLLGALDAYGLGTVDWRVALGGRTNLSDAEVHAELVNVLGKEQDDRISAVAKELKKEYNLPKPIGCHLRDAVGVAVGAFLMKRHGTPAEARKVWSNG